MRRMAWSSEEDVVVARQVIQERNVQLAQQSLPPKPDPSLSMKRAPHFRPGNETNHNPVALQNAIEAIKNDGQISLSSPEAATMQADFFFFFFFFLVN
jgi:hypothetical protein